MNTSTSRSSGRRRWPIILGLIMLLFVPLGVWGFNWWNKGAKRATCCMNLRNYNQAIAGAHCTGMIPYDQITDPDVVIASIKEKIGMGIPTCPDGGTCSLIYEPDIPNMPRLVCTKQAEGHSSPR